MRCEDPVKIIEILRLWEQGLSQREIALSVKCGKTTVGEIQRRCRESGLGYAEAEGLTNEAIRDRLYPGREILNTEEGLTLMTAGIKDVHWEWGGPQKKFIVPINEGAELMAAGWTDWVNALGTYSYRWGAANYYDSAFAWGLGVDDPFKLKLYEMTNCGSDYSEFDNIDPLDGTDESVIRVNYNEALKNAIARICLAGSEDEASAFYDEFIAAMDNMGMPKVEQTWTERYAENNR